VSEERWKLALEATGDGVWDWSVRTGELTVSKKLADLYGYSEQEYGNQLGAWTSRIHPDDMWRVKADLQRYLAGDIFRFSNEHRGQCKDGSWRWVLSRGAIVSVGRDGKPLRMTGTHIDIEQRKQAEQALAAATQFQQAVFDALPQHIAVLNREGAIVQTNLAWRNYAISQSDKELLDIEGGHYMTILARMTGQEPEAMARIQDGIAAIHSGENTFFQTDAAFYAPVSKRWFMLRATPVHDVAERIVISHDDVTDLKAAELASRTLANMDGLTGALSRRNFFELAELELTRSKRYQLPLMLLMLDLDHFKLVNDQFGHVAGDAVLRGFVQTVRGLLRESDLIGRLGGEEFAVLLPNTTPGGGVALAQRIVERVRTSTVAAEGKKIPYTVSVGVGYLTANLSLAELLGQADRALNRAKHGGRNRLEVKSSSAAADSLDQ
jgi:diguanylate cyclase (GGDEF)-like protein/PAS domain S-box-containing protein